MTEDDQGPDVPLPRRAARPGGSDIGRARVRLYGEGSAPTAGDARWAGVQDRERSAALARAALRGVDLRVPAPAPATTPAAGEVEEPGTTGAPTADGPPPAPDPGNRAGTGPWARRVLVLAAVLAIGVVVGLVVGRSSVPTAAAAAPAPPPWPAWSTTIGQVVTVRDGDTVAIRLADRVVDVVIVGLDTPDPATPGTPAQCGAASATAYAADTLTGQVVTLVPDPSLPEVDAQGRRLAYVVLRTQLSYTDLALSEGIGRRSTTPVAWYDDVFEREETAARAAGAGIWGAPCRTAP